jgi:predicted DNA-binding protein (UPF0251 family)
LTARAKAGSTGTFRRSSHGSPSASPTEPIEREVVTLRFQAGLTSAEIGDRMGRPRPWTRDTLLAAYAKIAESLADRG